MTVRQILRNSTLSPLDLEILLSYVLKKTRERILAHPEKKLSKPQLRKFNSLLQRRKRDEPIAHLTGQKEFYGLGLFVDRNVLIPRPETELLIETALKNIQVDEIFDIGTGSGNIIISIAKNIRAAVRNKINFSAVDISDKALAIAKKNARKHRVDRSIKFIRSDLLEFINVKKIVFRKNILMIANLPYVSPALYKKHRKGLRFEPKNALLSQKNGLGHYIRLIKQILGIRAEINGAKIRLLLEISPEQKRPLQKIIKEILPKSKIYFQRDLAGKWRMADIRFDQIDPKTKDKKAP